ncbi:MAG: F0F1 ATP synthase subunit delta [Bacteroidales bacterium]|nr:F0F1 ATP synthase subunit delta [Bacteroidales bacterium]
MNTGVISSRYARALLLLTQESGRGEQVFAQARALLKNPETIPDPLEEDLRKLVLLVNRNGRGWCMRFILNDFIHLYCESTGARLVRLISAVDSPGLYDRISRLLGGKVYVDTEVDPGLEGGFVLIVGDRMVDASVKGQIERIRREFTAKNQRLV